MKKVLKIFLCILFFPIALTVLIIRSKKLAPKIKAPLIALIWIFCIIIGAADSEKASEPDSPSDPVIIDTQPEDSILAISCVEDAASIIDIPDDTAETSENSSAAFTEVSEEELPVVQEISDFAPAQYTVYVGDSITLSTDIKPSGLDGNSITVESSAPDILKIHQVAIGNDSFSGTATILCDACAPGETVVTVKSADGTISSNAVTICVEALPVINSFSVSGGKNCVLEEGDNQTFSLYIEPKGTVRDAIVIENADDSVACLTENAFYDNENSTVLDFTIAALKVGETIITFRASDGKTSPVEIRVSVAEKDTSPTVYITPTGECYHFSKTCAGENAIETTLNKAGNYRPCSKCG